MENAIRKNTPGELLHPFTYAVTFEVNEKHKHTVWELTIILRGSGKSYINERPFPLQRGSFFISRPGDWHYYRVNDKKNYEHRDLYVADEDMQLICKSLSPDLYKKLTADTTERPIMQLSEEMLTLLDRKLRLLQLSNPDNITENDRIVQRSIASFMLGMLFENEKNSSYPPWLTHVLTEMNTYRIICGSLENVISLTDFSHEHLSREFKKYVGISPIEYLIRQKMNYAALLLRQTDKSILQIASLIGYDSLSYFISVFKKYFHMSPKQYRKADASV